MLELEFQISSLVALKAATPEIRSHSTFGERELGGRSWHTLEQYESDRSKFI
ncbi:hypothetical protein [Oxynema aestuarii]|uniref:Uncharacterized protein n=1 Tax=Oxynema aestuarii AP17 TaxID=2064643 RepID=A0A6H1TVW0_9CYAN|nr:hypothetical protein [Oxynema aestuarii]QIZ70287.1 hypothetical protein HCG48_06605 [Oxynema aestuarii AP17]